MASMGTVSDVAPEAVADVRRRTGLRDFVSRLIREKPLGTIGAAIVILLLVAGIFCDLEWLGLPDIGLAPYGVNESHVADRLQGPSSTYWLGTDNMGRDQLTRILYGARVSLVVGLSATMISIVISTIGGAMSGYIGGKFDLVFQRFVDAYMTFPTLVILIVLASLVGQQTWQIILVLGLQFGIAGTRSVRGPVIAIKANIYMDAAKASGCSVGWILWRHVLPNVMAPIIILFTTRVPAVIMTEAGLSFLGFGVPPPNPSWGGMLSGAARSYMLENPWMAVWPGLALAIVVYGINMFGDALRDLLDPRLRGGIGRYSGAKIRKKSMSQSQEQPA